MLLAINQNKSVQSVWKVEKWRRRSKKRRLNFQKGTAKTRSSWMRGSFRKYTNARENKGLWHVQSSEDSFARHIAAVWSLCLGFLSDRRDFQKCL